MSRARSLSLLANENAISVDQNNSYIGIGSTIPSSPLNVGLGITMDGPSGIVTATKFVGDGSGIRDVSVGGASSIAFDDSVGAYWGADEDLGIYHNATHSYIVNKTNTLRNQSDAWVVLNGAGDETQLRCTADEGVDLYYNDAKKLETTNTGAVVTGILTATTNAKVGDYIALDHSATGGTVTATHFSGNITGTAATFTTVSVAGTITHEDVTNVDSTGIVTAGAGFRATTGGIQISAGIATLASGVDLNLIGGGAGVTSCLWDSSANSLEFLDNSKTTFGDGNDLSIFHDGSHSYILNETGEFKIRAATFKVVNEGNSEIQIVATEDGSVDLYYNHSKKFETTNAGVIVTGVCTAQVPNIPQVSKSGSYTLVKSDAGKHIYNSSTTEAPANVFAAGDMITIYNNSGSTQNVNQGSGLTMYLSDGEGNSGNRDLKQRCVCTILYTSTTEAVISGGGLE